MVKTPRRRKDKPKRRDRPPFITRWAILEALCALILFSSASDLDRPLAGWDIVLFWFMNAGGTFAALACGYFIAQEVKARKAHKARLQAREGRPHGELCDDCAEFILALGGEALPEGFAIVQIPKDLSGIDKR